MEQETGAPSASGDSSITWGSSFINNLTFLLNMCLCAFSVCILRGLNTISVFFPVSVNLQLAPLIPRTSWFVLYIWLGGGAHVFILSLCLNPKVLLQIGPSQCRLHLASVIQLDLGLFLCTGGSERFEIALSNPWLKI